MIALVPVKTLSLDSHITSRYTIRDTRYTDTVHQAPGTRHQTENIRDYDVVERDAQ